MAVDWCVAASVRAGRAILPVAARPVRLDLTGTVDLSGAAAGWIATGRVVCSRSDRRWPVSRIAAGRTGLLSNVVLSLYGASAMYAGLASPAVVGSRRLQCSVPSAESDLPYLGARYAGCGSRLELRIGAAVRLSGRDRIRPYAPIQAYGTGDGGLRLSARLSGFGVREHRSAFARRYKSNGTMRQVAYRGIASPICASTYVGSQTTYFRPRYSTYVPATSSSNATPAAT